MLFIFLLCFFAFLCISLSILIGCKLKTTLVSVNHNATNAPQEMYFLVVLVSPYRRRFASHKSGVLPQCSSVRRSGAIQPDRQSTSHRDAVGHTSPSHVFAITILVLPFHVRFEFPVVILFDSFISWILVTCPATLICALWLPPPDVLHFSYLSIL